MSGLMQDRPSMISSLPRHAARFHPDAEIVSRLPTGPARRTARPRKPYREHARPAP
jgi:fatty-acyl-CoA synthase